MKDMKPITAMSSNDMRHLPGAALKGVNELLLTTAASRAAERYLILQGGVEYRQSFVVISALTGLVVSARGGGSSEGVITRGCLLIIAVLLVGLCAA